MGLDWWTSYGPWDLENEIQRLEKILRAGVRKHGLNRRARYGRRLQECKAALLAKKLSGEYDESNAWPRPKQSTWCLEK